MLPQLALRPSARAALRRAAGFVIVLGLLFLSPLLLVAARLWMHWTRFSTRRMLRKALSHRGRSA